MLQESTNLSKVTAAYLSIKDAAEYLGMSHHTLYRLAERREIPAAKVGGSWRLSRTALDEFISARSTAHAPRILVVAADNAEQDWLTSVIRTRSSLAESVASPVDGLIARDGLPFDLVIYATSADARGLRKLLENFTRGTAAPRLAIIADIGDISAIGPALDVGPVLVLRRPVERIDLTNLLTLITH